MLAGGDSNPPIFLMQQYKDMLRAIRGTGEWTENRTGIRTQSIFGYQFRHNLADGFPLLTTKRVHWKSIVVELLWMLRGESYLDYLHQHGVTIWDEWADEDGDLGPVYGAQWRRWYANDGFGIERSEDQIADVIKSIRENPTSRRHIVSAWNVTDIPHMALPPCHVLFQFSVSPSRRLSCHMYQRSADAFLGVPFNIASYALLTHIIAALTDCTPGQLIISYGDLHIYENHQKQVTEQLSRQCRPLPKLVIVNERATIDGFKPNDFELVDYNPHPSIHGDVAV